MTGYLCHLSLQMRFGSVNAQSAGLLLLLILYSPWFPQTAALWTFHPGACYTEHVPIKLRAYANDLWFSFYISLSHFHFPFLFLSILCQHIKWMYSALFLLLFSIHPLAVTLWKAVLNPSSHLTRSTSSLFEIFSRLPDSLSIDQSNNKFLLL